MTMSIHSETMKLQSGLCIEIQAQRGEAVPCVKQGGMETLQDKIRETISNTKDVEKSSQCVQDV